MAKPTSKTEQHYRVYRSHYESFAYRSLSHKALALFHHMLTQFNGRNNGNISATLNMMKHFGWASSATLSSAIKELLEHELIKKTRQGGMGAMKQCSLYAFTHLPISESMKLGIKGSPATHAYREYNGSRAMKVKSPARKVAAINDEANPGEENTLVQNLNGAYSEFESERPITDSNSVGWPAKTLQILNTGKHTSNPVATRNVAIKAGHA